MRDVKIICDPVSTIPNRKKCKVYITGKQEVSGEHNVINLVANGMYATKDGIFYISYREYVNDSHPESGEDVLCVLKVEKNRVTLIKHNYGGTKLIIEGGKRHTCYYFTEFGNLCLGVFGKKISSCLSETGGALEFTYTLDINSKLLSTNSLKLEIKP